MDTMAQDLQKREEPPRIEEGESPPHKKFICSPLKMCTLDKYGFIYHPDPKNDNFVDRKKEKGDEDHREGEKRTISKIEMELDILEDGAIKTIEGIQILKKGLNKFAKMCKDKDV